MWQIRKDIVLYKSHHMHMSHYRSGTRTINMSRCRMSQITRIQSQLVNQRNVSRELSNRAANILEAVITIWIWFYECHEKGGPDLKENGIIRSFANLCHRL